LDGNNIDNDDEQQQQQLEQDQEQQAAAAADNDAHRRKGRVKLVSVLDRNEEFSFRTRNKIDVLTERFLRDLENDIFDMLCDNGVNDYHGLDSDRDTEQEVETTIRFFPEILSRQKAIVLDENEDDDDDDDDDDEEEEEEVEIFYPIEFLSFTRQFNILFCNMKAVSFIPVLARVAIELGLFEEKDRGGLLRNAYMYGYNVLQRLMCNDTFDRDNPEHRQVDDKYLQVLIQLRQIGCLKKDDMQQYGLLKVLCQSYHFSEKRFRFLVEWDPALLIRIDEHGYLPFHHASICTPIPTFQLFFEYGIRYFPKKKGINLLFRKNNHDGTPFQRACNRYGRDEVMKVVDDTLIRYSSSSDNDNDNDTPSLNIVDALITAAIDEKVHLDCVYFLLRREPDVLKKLLSSTPAVVVVVGSNNNNHDDDDDDGGGGGEGNDGNNNLLVTGSMNSSKKRKRT
jgi:hypothetical protein